MSEARPHKRPDRFDVILPDHEDLSTLPQTLDVEDGNHTHLTTATLFRRSDGQIVVRLNRKDLEHQPWP